ncbi:MAG: type VII toxin-antitoxin system HepT family RNase toxin [Candidatus Rokuibacteriota bacterium]
MIDRDRVLAKLDDLEGYLAELRSIAPATFEEYLRVEKKRACERLLQVAVEAVIDVCALLVTGLRLGLPGEEDDLFEKLQRREILTGGMAETLRRMKGFRNILVHEYGRVADEIVFDAVRLRLGDFEALRREITVFLRERTDG